MSGLGRWRERPPWRSRCQPCPADLGPWAREGPVTQGLLEEGVLRAGVVVAGESLMMTARMSQPGLWIIDGQGGVQSRVSAPACVSVCPGKTRRGRPASPLGKHLGITALPAVIAAEIACYQERPPSFSLFVSLLAACPSWGSNSQRSGSQSSRLGALGGEVCRWGLFPWCPHESPRAVGSGPGVPHKEAT